jgi:hypothetical protein
LYTYLIIKGSLDPNTLSDLRKSAPTGRSYAETETIFAAEQVTKVNDGDDEE